MKCDTKPKSHHHTYHHLSSPTIQPWFQPALVAHNHRDRSRGEFRASQDVKPRNLQDARDDMEGAWPVEGGRSEL